MISCGQCGVVLMLSDGHYTNNLECRTNWIGSTWHDETTYTCICGHETTLASGGLVPEPANALRKLEKPKAEPDETIEGLLVGVREFRINEYGELMSLVHGGAWSPDKPQQATCYLPSARGGPITTAPVLIHRNAGEPGHKYHEESYKGPCATCSMYVEVGVGTEQINNKTFSNHSEFFKFGGHVCRACAWLYGDPKRTHRNVLAVGDELWWPMIGVDSATEERPSWFDLLQGLPDRFDGDEPQCGVLTTDPKPRNWPRMTLGTSRHLSLYVHAPDYDTATVVHLNILVLCNEFLPPIRSAQVLGFSKQRIYHGLLSDFAKTKKDPEGVMQLEMELRKLRSWPDFVPALLISGLTKEEKDAAKSDAVTGGEPRRDAVQDSTRLF